MKNIILTVLLAVTLLVPPIATNAQSTIGVSPCATELEALAEASSSEKEEAQSALDACRSNYSSQNTSSNNSGPGISNNTVRPAQSTTNTVRPTQSINTPPQSAAYTSTNITRTLTIGSKGADVSKLQEFLRQTGDFTYPENTGYYGQATAQAVQKYQCNKINVCSGTPNATGYGQVGPSTRAAIAVRTTTAVSKGLTTTDRAVSTQIRSGLVLIRNLLLGMSGDDVTKLQEFLRSLGDFTYPENTGYYGQVTAQAVQKYQCRTASICSGTPDSNGYGVVGPKTRATIATDDSTTTDNDTGTADTDTGTDTDTTDTDATADTSTSVVTLPVRIHMLGGTGDSSVDTVLTETEIQTIFENSLGVNENYWEQAGIQFEIESVVSATPVQVSDYTDELPLFPADTYGEVISDYGNKTVVNDAGQQLDVFGAATRLLAPTGGLLENGFNVVVVHDFGYMGGGLYTEQKIIYVPEKSVKGDIDTIRTFAFAHELGHSLGLAHYDANTDPYNVMAISDPTTYNPQDKNNMTDAQIKIAGQVASTGLPGSPRDFDQDTGEFSDGTSGTSGTSGSSGGSGFSLTDEQQALADSDELITIPLSVYMLGGTGDTAVDTTKTEAQIRDYFANALGVNENYWTQAGIEFEIENYYVNATPNQISGYKELSENIIPVDTYGELIANPAYAFTTTEDGKKYNNFGTAIAFLNPGSGEGVIDEPGGGARPPLRFNAVVVHDFGYMGGGMYLPGKAAVYIPEKSVKGDSDIIRTFAFAHELGHSLGLKHHDANTDPYNVMAISDPTTYNPQEKDNLTAGQIKVARNAAVWGVPVNPAYFDQETGEWGLPTTQ